MKNYFTTALDMSQDDSPLGKEKLIEFISSHSSDILKDSKRHVWPKEEKEYKYMLTFTMDPSVFDDIHDPDTQDLVQLYIEKVLSHRVIHKSYYVKEHADSNCHWHAIIHTKYAYNTNNLAYYRRYYGHVDLSRSTIKTDEFSMKYLEKENKVTIIKGTLNTPQKLQT